jgi:hypothetical protein
LVFISRPVFSLVGFIACFDEAFNSGDKVLGPGLGRKISLGFTFGNKESDFRIVTAAGLKGWKLDLYSPLFRQSFLQDVRNNYTPIGHSGEDSLIGAEMNSQIPGLWGTYAYYGHAGLIWKRNFFPCVNFYAGQENHLLHNEAFRKYVDPKNQDFNYETMSTFFYEIKIGTSWVWKIQILDFS